jgi:hypothetical protein
MSTGAAVSAVVLGFVLMPLPAVLWPKKVGHYYLRYHLSRRGIRSKDVPHACLREFVDDAFHYSRAVSTPPSRPGTSEPRIPDFEFERMLRIHCGVVHALLTGRAAAHVDDKAVTRPLIRSEMLRAGTRESDVAECQRIESEVRTGKSWDRHRAILSRYDLPQPMSRTGVGQLTH